MQPSVAMVCLYADTPQFVDSMLASYRSQQYSNKTLLIYDSGADLFEADLREGEKVIHARGFKVASIGMLRNWASTHTSTDILMHLDADDWSSPERMADQVFQLEATGADVVGYSDMLFWREQKQEAWLYTAHKGGCPVLGTSLAYRREYWQKHPFPDQPRPGFMASEYKAWVNEAKVDAKSSFRRDIRHEYPGVQMVARIHAGNSKRQNYQLEELIQRGSLEWKRVPLWAGYLKGLMA